MVSLALDASFVSSCSVAMGAMLMQDDRVSSRPVGQGYISGKSYRHGSTLSHEAGFLGWWDTESNPRLYRFKVITGDDQG